MCFDLIEILGVFHLQLFVSKENIQLSISQISVSSVFLSPPQVRTNKLSLIENACFLIKQRGKVESADGCHPWTIIKILWYAYLRGKTHNNKDKSYWVTNRLQIEVSLRMVLNVPQALGQQNKYTKKRQLLLYRVSLCMLCHGQFSLTCVVLISWLSKNQFHPLLLVKNPSLHKNSYCHPKYL